MTLTNSHLIQLVKTLGEDKILNLLQKKIANDTYRANYMKNRNELVKKVKNSPEYQNLLKKMSK